MYSTDSRTTTVCENDYLTLSCGEYSGKKLKITAATYGRTSDTVCTSYRSADQLANTDCKADVLSKVGCQGRWECIMKVDDNKFGNPCDGTYKYLQVTWHCQ